MLQDVGAPVYDYYEPDRAFYERIMINARSQLGEETFEEARYEGREMTFDEVVAYALGDDAASRV